MSGFIFVMLIGQVVCSLETGPGKVPTKSHTMVQWGNGRGQMLCPETTDKVAGLVLVPDAWGLNQFMQSELENWRAFGVCVLAIDFLADKLPNNEKEAERLKDQTDSEKSQQMILGAIEYLAQQARVDGQKMGLLAWGDGGIRALKVLAQSKKISAAALVASPIYYQISSLKSYSGKLQFIYPQTAEYKAQPIREMKSRLHQAHLYHEFHQVGAKALRYYDITHLKDYDVKAAARTKELVRDFFDRFLTLKQIRKEPML